MQKAFEKIIERLEEKSKRNAEMGYMTANDVTKECIEIVNQVAEEYKDGHSGCNTNGEHEKCNGCGMAEKCPDYKREWFEKLKNDVPEINAAHVAWETVYKRILELEKEYAAVNNNDNVNDCTRLQNLMQFYKEQLTEEAGGNLTNGDKIRSMTDKELIKVILCPYDTAGETADVMPCVTETGTQELVSPEYCEQCMLNWLERECS